ncbi:hypothetical protein EGI22_16505 [Lacihabitans sp. LS3-19]|nr:hypothetical protein [Lacihabitans sp. LS3-19]
MRNKILIFMFLGFFSVKGQNKTISLNSGYVFGTSRVTENFYNFRNTINQKNSNKGFFIGISKNFKKNSISVNYINQNLNTGSIEMNNDFYSKANYINLRGIRNFQIIKNLNFIAGSSINFMINSTSYFKVYNLKGDFHSKIRFNSIYLEGFPDKIQEINTKAQKIAINFNYGLKYELGDFEISVMNNIPITKTSSGFNQLDQKFYLSGVNFGLSYLIL